MVIDVTSALGALARKPVRAQAPPRRALVVGAGGALGSAVLEQLLAARRFERVGAVVEQAMQPALLGFVPVASAGLAAFAADTALVVFDRQRNTNGRELVFARPEPSDLPVLARALHDAGVRCLLVVVPHTASLLPQALQQGLASLDEAAVAALGFEQVVFMRMAQDERAAEGLDAPRWLARWMISQLRWMIPQREQPVRAQTVGQVAAALADQLHDAPQATRVLPAALLWQAAQRGDVPALVADWLAPRR